MKNKIALTLISFLANFIMAGFASQFGMLIEPIAVRYSADVNTVASIFSLLNGGALAGTIAAFFLIEKIGVKRMTLIIYSIVFLCALAMHLSSGLWPVMVAMTLVGFCGGIGLCVAGTIVVSVWQDRIQSTMLVVQDATFNVAGVVFPLITTFALTHNMSWSYSYLSVGIVALLTLVGELVSTVIVSRVKIHYFLLSIILLACVITTIIVTKENISGLDYLAYSYGFVCAALYNSFIAYGVSFVKRASSQNVSYILISGSAGAMFSPAISALMEKTMGLQKIMYAIPVLYLIIFIMLMGTLKLKRN